jgi:hypothetical protein
LCGRLAGGWLSILQTFVTEQQVNSNGEQAIAQPASDFKPGFEVCTQSIGWNFGSGRKT